VIRVLVVWGRLVLAQIDSKLPLALGLRSRILSIVGMSSRVGVSWRLMTAYTCAVSCPRCGSDASFLLEIALPVTLVSSHVK